jgi:hypothetical protein
MLKTSVSKIVIARIGKKIWRLNRYIARLIASYNESIYDAFLMKEQDIYTKEDGYTGSLEFHLNQFNEEDKHTIIEQMKEWHSMLTRHLILSHVSARFANTLEDEDYTIDIEFVSEDNKHYHLYNVIPHQVDDKIIIFYANVTLI